MTKRTRSGSNISITEFLSATDFDTDVYPAKSKQSAPRNLREYAHSPLLGGEIEIHNRNTVVHCTQSAPNLALEMTSYGKPETSRKGKARNKKNALLDEVSNNFSQESVDILKDITGNMSTTENIENEPDINESTTSTTINKPTTTRGRKKKDENKKGEANDGRASPTTSTSNSKLYASRQNDLLESIRVMINKTVGETVESSTRKIHEDINTLKTTLNTRIDNMSEKETRHHLESTQIAREDKEGILTKLASLEELKPQMQSIQNKMEKKMDEMENILNMIQTTLDDRCSTIEITEDHHHKLTMDRMSTLEKSQRSLAEKFTKNSQEVETWGSKIKELETDVANAKENIKIFEEGMSKLKERPENFASLNDELAAKKIELDELMSKATKLIEKIEHGNIDSQEINKIKMTGEANTVRLDKIQKDEKMLNLLLSNLPPVLQSIQGFSQFAYNELNVELTPGDILFINKVFESTSRVVHLARFRSLEVRNAVLRGRINLGFRSNIWINEDLIPSKEALALGARRRFRVGKIAKNWTYQGEVFITMKNDPTPIKITKEEDFPQGTELQEGEGMLPRELPVRRNFGLSFNNRFNRQHPNQYNYGPPRQINSLNPNAPPRNVEQVNTQNTRNNQGNDNNPYQQTQMDNQAGPQPGPSGRQGQFNSGPPLPYPPGNSQY